MKTCTIITIVTTLCLPHLKASLFKREKTVRKETKQNQSSEFISTIKIDAPLYARIFLAAKQRSILSLGGCEVIGLDQKNNDLMKLKEGIENFKKDDGTDCHRQVAINGLSHLLSRVAKVFKSEDLTADANDNSKILYQSLNTILENIILKIKFKYILLDLEEN